MSERDIGLYLLDILDSIKKIEKYTKNLSYREFCANQMAIDAVVRNMEIIGEASSHIPAEFRKKYQDVPWSKMKSMRNKVIHEYFGVDLDVVWETINEDLPGLGKMIRKIIKQENIKP